MAINAKIVGLEDAIANLARVGNTVKKKATRAAAGAGAKIMTRDMKTRARRVTGLLYKSIAWKVKVFRETGVAVGIVGPRRGVKVIRDKVTRKIVGKEATKFGRLVGTRNGKPVFQDPAKYSHLVEKGTKRSKAFPFVLPTFNAMQRPAQQAMANVITNAIEDAARGGA